MTPLRPWAAVLGVAALAASLGACKVTYDKTITTGPVVATTTTLPTGTAAELLPRLVAEAGKLSDLIGTHGDDNDAAEQITALWAAAQPEVESHHPELVEGFNSNVAACATAARRNRPADADKAFRNLQVLTTAYLGDLGTPGS